MSALADAQRDAHWQAGIDAGFYDRVLVKQSGKPAAIVHIDWKEPTQYRLNGDIASSEFLMEYRFKDLPALQESDPVSFVDDEDKVIKTQRFKVRQAPTVTDLPRDDQSGYYRLAILTQI